MLLFLTANSQENIFILVDVSESSIKQDLINAKQALFEILSGNNLSNSFVQGGNSQDLAPFKLNSGDKVSISKFGDQQTTKSINPNPVVINNIATDLANLFSTFPIEPKGKTTYVRLAKAKIAEYAKKNNIKTYKLYMISDEYTDNFGSNGKPNYSDPYFSRLADEYDTKNNPAHEDSFILVRLNNSTNKEFKLTFIPKVDLSKYNLPGNATPSTTTNSSYEGSCIQFCFPLKGDCSTKEETEIKTGTLQVCWSCQNCPDNARFDVRVNNIKNNKIKEIKNIPLGFAKFDLPDGKYKVTVFAINFSASATTTVTISTFNPIWIILFLFLLAAATCGYWYWNKKRQEKINSIGGDGSNDIFSSSGTSNIGSDNTSGYF